MVLEVLDLKDPRGCQVTQDRREGKGSTATWDRQALWDHLDCLDPLATLESKATKANRGRAGFQGRCGEQDFTRVMLQHPQRWGCQGPQGLQARTE